MALVSDTVESKSTAMQNPTDDRFTTISLDSLHDSRICCDRHRSLSHHSCEDGSDGSDDTLCSGHLQHRNTAVDIVASNEGVSTPSAINATVPTISNASPSSLRLAEMHSNAKFSTQRFYNSVGGWILPGILSSCFQPMWNNFFSTRNEPSLTSSSSEGSDGDSTAGVGFEIALEQIDVNFKEDYVGGGNQSSVFRGTFNGRYIALKKLNRASEVDIFTLASLNHANIIKTIGVCTRDIYPIIIMEYCEKGGLFDVLRKVEVTKSRFLQWAGEIVDGMKYLHSRKIVHRDLKSPNILVDSEDRLKICDFGSLYAWEKTFMPSIVMSVCGTSQWMSPEMLKNEPCNEKVDVWSFGVVLWELLTQEIPYKSISPMAIMYGVGSGQLKLHVPKSVPSIVDMLLCSCWAKRTRNRPSFISIGTHLANLRVAIADMSEDAWQMRKSVWRREISEENAKRCVFSGNAKDQEAEELVVKRQHELRHLQELRTVYEQKTERAERYAQEVFAFYDEIRRYEAELMQREFDLFGENKIHDSLTSGKDVFPSCPLKYSKTPVRSNNNDRIVTAPRSRQLPRNRLVKVEKSMVIGPDSDGPKCIKSDGKSSSNYNNRIRSCGNSGSFAVVTLMVSDEENDATDRRGQPNELNSKKDIPKNPNNCNHCEDDHSSDEQSSSARSSACSLRASDEEDAADEIPNNNVCTSNNCQMNEQLGRLPEDFIPELYDINEQQECNSKFENLNVAQPNMASNISTKCPCCQHQFFFDRNSLARASNMSSDSGFCHLDDGVSRNNSYFTPDISASNSTNNFTINHSASGTFERFHPNNTTIKASSTSAALNSDFIGKSQRNRPIHIGAIGRANGMSNGSISTSRAAPSTRQNGSFSFDESDCAYQNNLYRNVQGRWSDGKIKQRGLLVQSQRRRTSRPVSHAPNLIGMNNANSTMHNTSNLVNSIPSTSSSINSTFKSQTISSQRQETKSTNLTVDSGLSQDIIDGSFENVTSKRCSGSTKYFTKDRISIEQLPARPQRQFVNKDTPALRQKVLNKESPVDIADRHQMLLKAREQLERPVDVDEDHRYYHSNDDDPRSLFRRQNSSRELSHRFPKLGSAKRHYSSSQLLTRQNIPSSSSVYSSHGHEHERISSPCACSQSCDTGVRDNNLRPSRRPSAPVCKRTQQLPVLPSKYNYSPTLKMRGASVGCGIESMPVSSDLEQSLEADAANSDGLSDKERELRAAKSSFKTHRRTASNPIYTPPCSYRATASCETSTESDNDPIYC